MIRVVADRKRRATILLMVVSVLALLFVIVTGFLSLARFDRVAFEDVRAGRDGEAALRAVNDLVLSMLREQWLDPSDPNSRVLDHSTGVTWEDIPGYRGAIFQASVDPVSDPTVTVARPWIAQMYGNTSLAPLIETRYAAISSLELVSPALTQPWVMELMLDADPAAWAMGTTDLTQNARVAFMDADGDGVPDSSFYATLRAAEIANNIAGVPIRPPRVVNYPPNALYPGHPGGWGPLFTSGLVPDGATTTFDELWKRYYELRRYDVAVRVVPHGGLVPLQASQPPGYAGTPWNWYFTAAMFNLIKKPDGAQLDPTSFDARFNQLADEAAAVEPLLRRRGGLLPVYSESQTTREDAPVPLVLREFEEEYPATMSVQQQGIAGLGRAEVWQRFNVGEPTPNTDAKRWAARARLDTQLYNTGGAGNNAAGGLTSYDRRHLLTATTASDDLARVQTDGFAAGSLGLPRGAQKFYLGKISEAFDVNGVFLAGGRGSQIVAELAGYYRDMLRGVNPLSGTGSFPAVPSALDDQAWHLAVNTVAFAAPRISSGTEAGAIDTVIAANAAGKQFIGYTPQPFITQVGVFDNEPEENDEQLSVIVELYNPNDPVVGSSGQVFRADPHALYLPQFAISFNSEYDPAVGDITNLHVLDPAAYGQVWTSPGPDDQRRLRGRSFMSFAFIGSSNFFQAVTPNHITRPVPDLGPTNGDLTIRLWRRGLAGGPSGARWHMIDSIELDLATERSVDDDDTWWATVWRDCNTDLYFGPQEFNTFIPPARWRMLIGTDPNKRHGIGSPDGYRESSGRGQPIGVPIGTMPFAQYPFETTFSSEPEQPDASPALAAASRFAPTVPLYTMNAMPTGNVPRNQLLIHGARRPESFPTPGFLLFVPRFAHTYTAGASLGVPITEALTQAFQHGNYSVNPAVAGNFYPADFGHMPIFSEQTFNTKPDSYWDEHGELPWGLLVFDYFTTINPAGEDNVPGNADDIDPLNVPGRINVNAAPWFVLASLPVLGPNLSVPNTTERRRLDQASPAFFNETSGVLFGRADPSSPNSHAVPVPFDNVRFPGAFRLGDEVPSQGSNGGYVQLVNVGGGQRWYRLGSWLAQSIAAYRDGIAYVKPGDPYAFRFRTAHYRNAVVTGEYQYRFAGGKYAPIRGQTGEKRRGFLSLGELVNVIGMDATPPSNITVPGGSSAPPYEQPLAPLGRGIDGTTGLPAVYHGDFMKAVSLMALLDTHFLTTRSNTFTIYVSLMDREDPQRSIRSQLTVDRSNLLPRLVHSDTNNNGIIDPGEFFTTIDSAGKPALIAERTSAYFNARYDD